MVALDGATGEVVWKYSHEMQTEKPCCGTHNRGLAIGYGRLYQITADARLIALDRKSGAPVWDTCSNPVDAYEVVDAGGGWRS